jgi:hypothetical protein
MVNCEAGASVLAARRERALLHLCANHDAMQVHVLMHMKEVHRKKAIMY